jgi:ribonuclease HII
MAKHYPDYGFERHKGYGTTAHITAVAELRPTAIHRVSFKASCFVESCPPAGWVYVSTQV